MILSIRTRLILLITLVFLSVLIFVLAAGAVALYWGLNEEMDRMLRIEGKRVVELFEVEFQKLATATGNEQTDLRDDLLEELDKMYGYKYQFAIFAVESKGNRQLYGGGGVKNVELLLPNSFLSLENGYYDHRINERKYRLLVSRKDWGTLILGTENRIYYEVAYEFKQILSVGAPLTLVLVLLAGWLLANLVMRPVVTVADTAEKITLSNLQLRLSEYPGKDEFGKLVETLNKMISRIEEGVMRVRQFTQDAAHELRTPLTILRGELELLYQQESLPDDTRASLQKTLDRAIAMSKIVSNLMLLAQSDAGRYPIEKKVFRLDEAMQETVDDAQILAEDRPIIIIKNSTKPVEFLGDEQLIRHLLLNLSDNALKYTQEGKIEFSLKSLRDRIEFGIEDTGIGIPEEDLPHIFDRFYRVDKARSRGEDGSGLGLAICQWIVHAHGGVINIESEVGKGTAVHISLPSHHPSKNL
jgi:heavy metal sensor kinase